MTFVGTPIVKINGTVVTVASLPPFKDSIGQRSQLQFVVVDTTGALAIAEYQSVTITDAVGTPIFGGFVQDATFSRIAYAPPTYGWTVRCIDNVYLADKRIAAATYVNKSCGDIISDLVTNYLAAEGVTGNGAAPTFTRSSVAYDDSGVQDASQAPRYTTGQYGQALHVEEGTTNLLSANQSSVETDTTGFSAVGSTPATISRDATTAWSGSASLKAVCDGTVAGQGFSATLAAASYTNGETVALSCYLKGSGTVSLSLAGVAASQFVKTSGTRFILNGSTFRWLGFNAYDLVENYTTAQVQALFTQLKNSYGVNVVRVWAFGESTVTSSPPAWCFQYGATGGTWNEPTFVKLDNIVNAAKTAGIKLILVTGNNWGTYGGKAVYSQWYNAANATSYNDQDFHIQTGIINLYKAYLNKLITRVNTVTSVAYSAEPTIMAWECINEGRYSGGVGQTDTNNSTSSSSFLTAMTNWYTTISGYIKSLDSNHLVGTGSITQAFSFQNGSPVHNGTTSYGLDFNLQHQISSIDYCDFHWYQWSDPNNDGVLSEKQPTAAAWYAQLQEFATQAAAMGKPLTVGECGMDKRSINSSPINYYPRDAYLRLVWQTLYQMGGSGVCLWEWHDDVDTGIHDTTSNVPANAPLNASDTTLLSYVTAQNAALASPQSIVLSGTWQRATLIVTLPNPLGAGPYGIQVATVGAQAVTFWADALQIEAKSVPTTWQIGGTARTGETLAIPTAGVLSPKVGSVAIRAWVDNSTRKQGQGFNRLMQIPRNGQTTSGIVLYHDQNSPNWKLGSDDDSGHNTSLTAPDYLTPDGWHLFHVVWSSTQLALYIDGVLAASAANPFLTAQFGASWWVGSASTFNQIDTIVDGVKASVSAKTADQVAAEAAGGALALAAGDTYVLSLDGNLTQVTPIQAGPTVTAWPINYESVSAHLDKLAQLAGFYWNIDANRVLIFAAYSTMPAPFVFDGTQADDGTGNDLIALQYKSPLYRNGQYVLGITETTSTQTETRKGDGTATAFTMSYPLHAVPTITLNGGAQTVGIAGVDTAKNWYWNKGSNVISQDTAGTKLLSTDTLQVVYVGEYKTLVYSQDDGQVTLQQSLEGNSTSGKVQAVTTDTTLITSTQGFQAASALLAKYATSGKILTFKT
ncbi:MAG: LamG-like jellyroll fold domain-containing protein, partial [Ktedonobacterales bacterium]